MHFSNVIYFDAGQPHSPPLSQDMLQGSTDHSSRFQFRNVSGHSAGRWMVLFSSTIQASELAFRPLLIFSGGGEVTRLDEAREG